MGIHYILKTMECEYHMEVCDETLHKNTVIIFMRMQFYSHTYIYIYIKCFSSRLQIIILSITIYNDVCVEEKIRISSLF